jgi:hypothetical protein
MLLYINVAMLRMMTEKVPLPGAIESMLLHIIYPDENRAVHRERLAQKQWQLVVQTFPLSVVFVVLLWWIPQECWVPGTVKGWMGLHGEL